ncbi:MAG TPA: nuclear transport factor 2 family protein [Planktothrix sp.]|jgi:ketosteroid isomerase-like protein
MTVVETQIRELEERLAQADRVPDPEVFSTLLDDHFVIAFDGKICQAKENIVAAHQPSTAQKFDRVELRDLQIVDHGSTAVVTCIGEFEGPTEAFVFKFMRVWAKKSDGWKIVAGAMYPVEHC